MAEYKDGSLWITFRLDGIECCILSQYIESIDIPGMIQPIPNSPPTVAGITNHGDSLISVVEMREVFGRMNLHKYIEQFSVMKEMHISWVQELERYVRQGGEFTKAVDPHKCMFGKWFDNFQTDNSRLIRLLKKIEGPHEAIHHCGAEIIEMKANGGASRQAEMNAKLEEAEKICKEDIVPLLERLIDIYSSVNRGVILVVNDGTNRAGLLVDEVRTLMPCKRTKQEPFSKCVGKTDYLRQLVLDGNHYMLEINVEQILGLEELEEVNT